jgi:signal transduction histidine kinase
VDTTGRFGLFSIRMRLEPLGGHMEVDSKLGHGTRVTLMAQLKHNGENKKEKVS